MKPPRVPGTGRNYAKTAMLMAFLIALLAIGGQAWGGYQGMLLFGSIGLVFNFLSYWFSDRLALMMNRAQPVAREQLPEVYEIVERLTRKAGIPMPRIYVIPSATPNAFATGRSPSHAAVAVTEGILRLLDRQATFKNLMEHHDQRETNILYPALDRVTPETERREILSRCGAWRR